MAIGRGNGRPDYTRGSSLASSLQSQPEVDTSYDFSRHVDEGYHSLSGSSLVNQSVQTISWGFAVLRPSATVEAS